jgi:outer membrane protein assembly factor BamB
LLAVCTLAAWWQAAPPAGRPHRVEWASFGTLMLIFGTRAALNLRFDLGAAMGFAAAIGLLHLALRSLTRIPLTTQRVFLTALCLTSAAAAYQPAPLPPARDRELTGWWPMFRGNPQRTGSLDPSETGPARPRLLWRFRCPDNALLYASPAIAGGEVVAVATQAGPAGDLFNQIYRLDAATGELIQTIDLPRAGVSSPAIRGPLIIVGEGYHEDSSCRLWAINSRSGGTRGGFFPTASHVESSPALDGRRAFFGAGEDGVFGVGIGDTGAVARLWHVPGHHVDSSPVVADGTVFAGSVPGDANPQPAVLAIDGKTGYVLWTVPVPLPVIAAPAFDAGHLFVALGNGKLDRDAEHPTGAVWCLDGRSGNRPWAVTTTASIYASPVCQGGRVYVVGGDGLCQCLRQSDGSRMWQTPLNVRVVASPIVSGGAMFVQTQDGTLVKLDADTGREVWRFDGIEEYVTGHDAHASPVLAGGRIFVAAGGHIFCIGDRGE